jgi:integrase/recombinase XerD
MKQDIYAVDRRVDNCTKRLEKSSISSHNVKLLKRFYKEEMGGDKEKITLQGNLECFSILSEHIDFRLDEASQDELLDLVTKINTANIHPGEETSPWTLLDYKRALKNFYKWLEDSEDPEQISFMSVYIPDSKKPRVDPDELLSVRDAEDMINSAFNARDKALMALLWDTGARISELLNINIRDITFKDELMGVNIRHGKNGGRKLYVVESKPLVENWLREHPTRRSGDPLFTILQSSNSTDGIRRQSYASASSQLNACAERVGLDERIRWNPHGWRRARATDMARRGMNQPNMNAFFGWVPGSDVPKYYIRLAQRDVERSIRQLYPGLDPLEEEGPKYLGENIPEYSQSDLRAYGIE